MWRLIPTRRRLRQPDFLALYLALCLAVLPLLARAGTPVLTLQSTVPSGTSDVTAFADQVELVNAATGQVVAGAVPNAGFETSDALAAGSYGYAPTGATWLFNGSSGIATTGSAFGNPPAPEGSRVAFLQTTSGGTGSVSQLLPELAAGYYQVRLRLAQRNTAPANQGVTLLLNGVEIGRYVPANDGAFHVYTSAVFPLGQVQLRLQAAYPPGAGVDVTAFVDDVTLLCNGAVVAGTPVANPSFETTGSLGSGDYAYAPTGTGWAFAGNAGIMTNGGDFGYYSNMDGPRLTGAHAAFLQTTTTGSSATLDLAALPVAGNYAVRLRQGQRNTGSADQKLYLYFDNELLANLTPTVNGGAFTVVTTTSVRPVRLPAITGVSPARSRAGGVVTLTGSNFDNAAYVSVDGVAVVPTSVSSTKLTFVLPAGVSAAPSLVVTTRYGLSNASLALAVQLTVRSTSPAANALTAPVASSAVALTFSEPVTAASAAGLRVYSAQAGGRKAGTVSVSGNTASFAALAGTPTTAFRPGELVSVSVPATVQTAGGLPVAKRVYQFTTALGAGNTGRANFLPPATGPDPGVGSSPRSVAVGDVDGDGDLDLLTANYAANSVSVRLNGGDASGSNTGAFSNGTDVAVGNSPQSVALGDVDGDGDLDLLAATTNSNSVSVRLNGGDASGSNTGRFGNGTDVAVGNYPVSVVLGDVDGDGDLDLLTANTGSNSVSVRLNGSDAAGSNTGVFGNGSNVPVGSRPQNVVVGDVDGDGDLDLLAANLDNNTASVRLNGGDASGSNTGVFGNGADVPVGSAPRSVVVGDVDGDGDLDLLTANTGSNSVSVRLNGGNAAGSNTGVFGNGADVPVGFGPYSVTLGDVDGDGDLDLLTANAGSNSVSVRLNGGDAAGSNTGRFSNGADPGVGSGPLSVALGDVDGDGDLDLLTANLGSNSASVRLNQPQAPLPVELTAFTAQAEGPAVRLRWATASELHSARFEVERSLDSHRFEPVGSVPAAGSSAGRRDYTLLDSRLPAGGTVLYYRLRQIDTDSTARYSPVRPIARPPAGLALFPNPTSGSATLTGAGAGAAVQVLDALGRTVLTTATDSTGTATLTLLAGLARGVYVVRTGAQVLRLTVQ